MPWYAEVARRIGVSGERDDIARFSPFTAPYLDPLPLDAHSGRLLRRYGERRASLNERLSFFLGRSRVATLTRDLGDRGACTGLGRCLWGCPREALYGPSATLRDCLRMERFTYRHGQYVSHLRYDSHGRVTAVVVQEPSGGAGTEVRGDLVVLAAGTLGTSRIYLSSLRRDGRGEVSLGGVMDNAHAVVPFVDTAHLGAPMDPEAYQFHLLALAVAGAGNRHEAHGQITTLRAAAAHPIVQSLPFDFRNGLRFFRRIRGALGVANVWRGTTRNDANAASLRIDGEGRETLVLQCGADTIANAALVRVVRTVRSALARLDCVAPAFQTQVLPLGLSVHYAGTLPMTTREAEHTCSADGRVRGFTNLLVADGAGFPSLPAKNLTFTLMANASRIADML